MRAGIFAPIQQAAIAALMGPQDSVEERGGLRAAARTRARRHAAFAAWCEGSFYVWPRLPEGVTCERLLAEHGSSSRRARASAPSGTGWARLSLASPDDVLDLGLERLVAATSG